MKTITRVAFTVAIIMLGGPSVAWSDAVIDWNTITLDAIRADKTAPPKAARALAITHASVFDAVNGITQTHERYLVSGRPAGAASPEAAATASAHYALVRMFPMQQAMFDAKRSRSLDAIPNSAEKNAGIHWGEWVANVVLSARAADGSGESVPFTPSTAAGDWRPTPPGNLPALLPGWQKVVCFAMTGGAQFRPPMPPVISTSVYAFDFNLTKQLGAKESETRTEEQTAIARFWADGPGTVTPPGHWNVIAQSVSKDRELRLEENARLFAMLNLALADAGILCWDCKFTANYWRPVTAIRDADADGNPATEPDPAWTPLLDTPPFPEYTSGHSTFSSAAATILGAVFGSDRLEFFTTSDAFPGFARRFHSFTEAAAEAGMSRIFGGIHFMSANQQGLQSGAKLGTYVVENFLKPRGPGAQQALASHSATTSSTTPGVLTAQAVPSQPAAVTNRPGVRYITAMPRPSPDPGVATPPVPAPPTPPASLQQGAEGSNLPDAAPPGFTQAPTIEEASPGPAPEPAGSQPTSAAPAAEPAPTTPVPVPAQPKP